jgi:bifunctional UDP-N-acetylglucosamine pyrophosphorylase/glucosamine-1-phosphate N-acetyltransferase
MNITILAAGNGTRMNSPIPKVLHLFHGKPMIVRLIEQSLLLQPSSIFLVVGKHYSKIKETIEKYIQSNLIKYIHQPNPLGTGDAIKQCLSFYKKNEFVLILNGDMPNFQSHILENFFLKKENILFVISKEEPNGYGRVKIHNSQIIKIIEEKDTDEEEKKIKLINTGIYYLNSNLLRKYIPKIQNKNKQNEYYLTSLFEISETPIYPLFMKNQNEKYILGVNTKEELENLYKK